MGDGRVALFGHRRRVRRAVRDGPAGAGAASRRGADSRRDSRSDASYYNGFDFADSVPIADRQWIVQAVAHARPEAVRLIELIDHRTTMAPLRDGSNLGLTGQLLSGRYRIRLDLERLDGGMRANRELVLLHELGHVVDHEFVRGALSYRYGAGYQLPVPPSLDAWGAPLTRLA